MMPNYQWNNQGFNCFNNFNNNPGCINMNYGFGQNQNMNIPGMNIGGAINWQGIYNTMDPNQNQNIQQMQNVGNQASPGKINVIFTTTKGIQINTFIDYGKTISDLIKLYFMRINRQDLWNQPQDICFICNARKMNFNDQTPVEKFFGSTFARVTINDIKGLIGADI